MNRANHPALALSAGDTEAAASTDGTAPGRGRDDRGQPARRAAIDGRPALVEQELLKLRKRCRGRELALARMAGAITMLRRANRALNDENVLLRRQVAELKERASSKAMTQHPAASNG